MGSRIGNPITTMAKSHKDVPQDADMHQIPRWARVALVGRTLRRVQPLLLATWPKATKKFKRSVERAIAEGELAASQAAPTPELKDTGMAAMDVYGTEPTDAETASYIAFAASRVSFAAREPQAGSAQFGIEEAVQAVYWYERNQKARGVTSSTVTAIWRDFNRLKSLSQSEGWNNKSPIVPEVFGPMWSKGPPKNWPKEASRPLTVKPTRKRPKPRTGGLDLPSGMIDFLESGNEFEFDSSKAECGPVRLKPLSHLRQDEFTIRTDGTPAQKNDPHRRDEGYYILRVIDLVGECDAYDPDGLLAWFSDYKMFGGYDVDHHNAIVFAKASWADIVADPAKYLNAQWNPKGRFVKYIHEPWKHCDFMPA